MHFGFALDFSDIDLKNIDLLDTYLDLSDTGIPSKHFLSRVMSSRRLEDVFKTCLLFAGNRVRGIDKQPSCNTVSL